jgi:hypothetical protein
MRRDSPYTGLAAHLAEKIALFLCYDPFFPGRGVLSEDLNRCAPVSLRSQKCFVQPSANGKMGADKKQCHLLSLNRSSTH